MLVDNKYILLKKNKKVIDRLTELTVKSIEITNSKSGKPTLILENAGQKLSYHSRYNPIQEAQTILEKQVDQNTENVLIIGVGLGYLIQELYNLFPNVKYSVLEPNLEVLKVFLENFNLNKNVGKNLDVITTDVDELLGNLNILDVLSDTKTKIIIHPLYEKLYSAELNKLNTRLKKYLESKKSSTVTNLMFQLRWLENCVVNFNEILKSPNLFANIDRNQFIDKPVLIVAAGPSLDQEIGNLKKIKIEKRAYIFAVGSAVNTLLSNDIIPDALFSYDPLKNNAKVVQKIKDLGLEIPLIFGSSVGFETLQEYPGKKVHFFTTQDSINTFLIKEENRILIPDAPTIAAITLDIVSKLKMGPIILVGQNLSFTKEKTYASGIEYIDNTVVDNKLANAIPMFSTTGEEIFTNRSYLEMRGALEYIILKKGLKGKVYNTTYNGLPIAGTEYFSLENLIEFELKNENIATDLQWDAENTYNIEEAIKNFKELEEKFDILIDDFKKILDVEQDIMYAFKNKMINNVPSLFDKFDKLLLKIESNRFYINVIVPVIRVQHQKFIKDSHKVKHERRPLKKMELFLMVYSKYLRAIHAAIIQIQPSFGELKKSDILIGE